MDMDAIIASIDLANLNIIMSVHAPGLNVLTQQPNMTIDYHPTENNTLYYPPQVESSPSRSLILILKTCILRKLKHDNDCLFDHLEKLIKEITSSDILAPGTRKS